MADQRLDELSVLDEADRRARTYVAGIGTRPVFPTGEALAGLQAFDEPLPVDGASASSTIALLDDVGTPATVETNGPRYFGFVTGATLPVAAAADRLALAWDNAALAHVTSPAAAKIEATAAAWLLDILDLPRQSAVGFTTSATAGSIIALTTARRVLLDRAGWDVDRQGLAGAPRLRVVVSELAHVVIQKALRVLGFGTDDLVPAPVDEHGRIDADRLPVLDDHTLLLLEAGEVNTGELDPFAALIPRAQAAGAWVHVDGAFGLWARASSHRILTDGVDLADSWTVDGHKWLNTPYDSAMVIVRDRNAMAEAMASDTVYSTASADAQKNLTLEFSRRARGIPVWAALRTLGRAGVADLVERTVELAAQAADGLERAGLTVANRVVLNQIVAHAGDAEATARLAAAVQRSGVVWLGTSVWRGVPVLRISVSSWRTQQPDVDALVELVAAEMAAVTHRPPQGSATQPTKEHR